MNRKIIKDREDNKKNGFFFELLISQFNARKILLIMVVYRSLENK